MKNGGADKDLQVRQDPLIIVVILIYTKSPFFFLKLIRTRIHHQSTISTYHNNIYIHVFFLSSFLRNKLKLSMDLIQQSEHLCYVHCNFCNTVLAAGIPWKRAVETVTVKCGHCSNLSYLSTRPSFLHHHTHFLLQDRCPSTFVGHQVSSETRKHQPPSSSFSSSSKIIKSMSTNPSQERAPVVKPPEKKRRLPSAYNQFMKQEIQRIKAAHPEIPHREAFSSAAKNWARYIPSSPSMTTMSTRTGHP
ncbi:protein CRABS CLAW-like [Impatiens glandulifera]|uniref:protein CRABS CLAW-like n=1 Tax=Impatiens glandulifera TaxID=253017 RepID=UPI001FB0E38A|nr:protein CRABS CLAW-like [Impatiens glandulifera]